MLGGFLVFLGMALAYMLGSLSMAVLASQWFGFTDPRTTGSKNAGATNVLRTGGKNIAILVLVGDTLKGFVSVLIAQMLGLEGLLLGLVAVAVVVGHIFPMYFGFKGGKGVATAFGAAFALYWPLAVVALLVFSVVVGIYRTVSLASLLAVASIPIAALVFLQFDYVLPLALIAALVIWKHKDNIQRLRQGSEPKVQWGKRA